MQIRDSKIVGKWLVPIRAGAGVLLLLIIVFGCGQEQSKHNLYKPYSSGTFKIIVTDDLTDTLFVEARALNSIPVQDSETELIPIVTAGVYYLNLTIDRPVTATFILNEQTYNVMVTPDDTTQMQIVLQDNDVTLAFRGKNSDINNYYLSKRLDLGYVDIRFPMNRCLTSSANYNLLKVNVDSVVSKELQFLNTYQSKYALPDWFYQCEKADIEYIGAGFKTAMPVANEAFHIFKDTLPHDYFDFLKRIEINNEAALLSHRYLLFLSDFFMTDLPRDQYNHLRGYRRATTINSHILARSGDVLSSQVKRVYYKHLLSNPIQYLTDSLIVDSLARSYSVSDYQDLLRSKGQRSSAELMNLSTGDSVPDIFATDEVDSLIALRSFESSVVYINFWATWCGPCIQNMPALNTMISEYAQNGQIVFVNICLDSDKAKWKTAIKRYKLKGINLVAEGVWNDKARSHFGIKGIPHYVLVDKGNIVFENNTDNAPDVKRKIDELLK